MKRKGISNLPLHGGRAPKWLFKRMYELSGSIAEVIIDEQGEEEFLERINDPYFFQAYANAVGWDWHSSGATTVLCAALKKGLSENERIRVAGGKGKTSLKTPEEIKSSSLPIDKEKMIKNSKMSAKVDSNCVQDSFNLYHHAIFFTANGDWSVIQQGMLPEEGYARRYHWAGESIESYVEEPHEAVASDKETKTLDLTAKKSEETQEVSLDLIKDNPNHLRKYITGQTTLKDFDDEPKTLNMPAHHQVKEIDLSERSLKSLKKAYEIQPEDYEELVAVEGVGKKSLRALALISELIYGTEPSWNDPVKYSYTVGGKDGTPYPVDREVYDDSIGFLKDVVDQVDDSKGKEKALKKLKDFVE